MDQLNKHYVAHFDMLGMSKLTMSNTRLALEKLFLFDKAKQDMLTLGIEFVQTEKYIQGRLLSYTFSDTIVIVTVGDSNDDLLSMIILSAQLFGRALFYSIPIRGAISFGEFLFNANSTIFAGPPLVNAYNIGEQSQWLGIVVDDIVAEKSRGVLPTATDGQQTIIEWNVPIKSGGTKRHYVVNWPPIFRNNFKVGP